MADGGPSEETTAAAPAAGASHAARAPSLVAGTKLAHFEVVALLGRGGFGEVYQARDTRLGRMVALKVLLPEIATPELRDRLVREAMAASALNHPGICTIHDLISVEGRYLIVMELVEGRTLLDAVAGGPLAPTQAVAIAAQVADALAEAHRAGILHRDVKPGNIMLIAGGHTKLLDFGLAKRFDEPGAAAGAGVTREGAVVGTLGYLSPEQLLARKVDERSDLFSLGVVLYEIVAGRRPFQGGSAIATADAILHSTPPPLGRAVPERLQAVIRRLLEKDPDRRFASAGQVVEEMRVLQAGMARRRRARRSRAAAVAAGAITVLATIVGGWLWHKESRVRWARQAARPEIARLVLAADYAKAADLAREARAVLPGDAELERLWQEATSAITADSVPRGAEVACRGLGGASSSPWQILGRTPLSNVRVAKGYYLWRVAKPGFRAAYQIWPTAWVEDSATLAVRLDEGDRAPAGMVRVAGGKAGLRFPGLQTLPAIEISDYWIDQHEVTNAEYSRFVEDGGYERRDLWVEPFVRNGKAVRWEEAMAAFRDSTGRLGPSTWEMGRFPRGQESYPAAGVSWYEAAAYARFVGKELPTLHHWSVAAQIGASHLIVPGSNFQGTGPMPAGPDRALSGFGTVNMAGNVKEWCWNEASPGRRYILGGGFGEPGYMFNDPDAQSPWERRSNFGFRCMRLAAPAPKVALAPIAAPIRDFHRTEPISDEVFKAYRGLYAYDRAPLDPRIEEVERTDDWTRQKVSFVAAYGQERVVAHLYLPRNATPPYQAVLLIPGSYGMYTDRYFHGSQAAFIPTTGRALIEPILKGTFERRDGLKGDYPEPTAFYRDHVIAWAKDVGRSLDYLESRPDIDHARFAYAGSSWGAGIAPVILAVEGRFRAAVLIAGGLPFYSALPEADAITFIRRAKVPTLVLNGRYDHFFPDGSSQRPFVDLLGTPREDKRFVQYDAGHSVPQKEVIRETTDWLDHYLGPVRR